jgi:hypothetical protein
MGFILMINITEKIFGNNGNAGAYYNSLPKGNEVFKLPKCEPL